MLGDSGLLLPRVQPRGPERAGLRASVTLATPTVSSGRGDRAQGRGSGGWRWRSLLRQTWAGPSLWTPFPIGDMAGCPSVSFCGPRQAGLLQTAKQLQVRVWSLGTPGSEVPRAPSGCSAWGSGSWGIGVDRTRTAGRGVHARRGLLVPKLRKVTRGRQAFLPPPDSLHSSCPQGPGSGQGGRAGCCSPAKARGLLSRISPEKAPTRAARLSDLDKTNRGKCRSGAGRTPRPMPPTPRRPRQGPGCSVSKRQG